MVGSIVAVLVAGLASGGAIGVVATAFFRWLTDRRTVQTDGWAKLAESYSRQMADMAKSYGELEARIRRVEERADREEERADREEERAERSERRANEMARYICVLRQFCFEHIPDADLPEVPEAIREALE